MMIRALARGPSGATLRDSRGAPEANTSRPRVTPPSGARNTFADEPAAGLRAQPRGLAPTAAVAAARNRPMASASPGGHAASRPSSVASSGAIAVATLARARGHGHERDAPAVGRVGAARDVARASRGGRRHP